MRIRLVSIACLLSLISATSLAQEPSETERILLEGLQTIARRLERSAASLPSAATSRLDPPLFEFAQLADIHWTPA